MPVPQNGQAIYGALTAVGFNPVAAAGVMGNIEQESGGNPEHQEPGCVGLVCWVPPNYGVGPRGASSGAGPLVTGDVGADIQKQAAYIAQTGGLAAALGLTPEDAASAFMRTYERCGNCVESNRRQSARDSYNAAQTGQWRAGGGVSLLAGSATGPSSTDMTGGLGTGLTLWDVVFNGGGLAELVLRLGETVVGALLLAGGLVVVVLTLAGKADAAAGRPLGKAAGWGKRVAELVALAL